MALSSGINYSLKIDKLLTDIYSSVNDINSKRAGFQSDTPTSSGTWPQPSVSAEAFSGYSSALNGQSLFSVQSYGSETAAKDSGAERYKRNVYTDADKSSSSEPLNTYTFKDFISTETKSNYYQQATALYQGGISPLALENNSYSSRSDIRNYAVHSYSYVADINKPSPVLIDFMHEYNRNFNFEI